MRLAVFLPNWIGDVTMATPALRALRALVGPSGELIGVMRPYVAEVLAGTPWLSEEILYKPRTKDTHLRARNAVARLRAAQPDTVLLLTNSLRTGIMAWRSGARRRVGTGFNLRRWLLTECIDPAKRAGVEGALPAIDSYLQLAYSVGCDSQSPRLELATLPEDEQAADAAWRSLGLPSGDRVVVLNSGGAYGAAKHWPTENFAELAKRIATQRDLHVLVNCGPAERDLAREIVRASGDSRVVSLADFEVPLGLTKACIRRSRLLVTTDSGPRFFGLAFQRPVVSLFGPTSPAMTQTHTDLETTLSLSLDCQPCGKRVCPLGHHRCMRDLSVDSVFSAVDRQLHMTTYAAA